MTTWKALAWRCSILLGILAAAPALQAAPSKVSFGGNFTLSPTSTLEMELGGDPSVNTTNTPVEWDMITMVGVNAVFTVGGSKLSVIPLGNAMVGKVYPIVKTSSGGSVNYSNLFSNLTGGTHYSGPGVQYTVSYSSTQIDVTFQAIPEPASLGLLILAALTTSRHHNRQKSRPKTVLQQNAQTSSKIHCIGGTCT